jgi:hypothetical protein
MTRKLLLALALAVVIGSAVGARLFFNKGKVAAAAGSHSRAWGQEKWIP